MAEEDKEISSGSMTYPRKDTLNRLKFKLPLILWRMGFGSYLSSKARGGSKMLVLTTWGRKSKVPRHTMLSYVSAGDREYVCSGWGERSDWVRNIENHPQVSVQIGRTVYTAVARRVENLDEFQQVAREMFDTGGDSHFQPWLESFGIDFNLQDMIEKQSRLYLMAFDPDQAEGPAEMAVDLVWVWGFLLLFVIVLYLVLA